MTVEQQRLQDANADQAPWREWGPYLSERQWGTVREDYSASGNAWDYFSHDQARSRAYRWGEDGLAGISDRKQQLCFALGLWNGNDPIIKERLFGLTNSEGNHGEDVKEYYYYLDSTPTHSYMRYLYKYPQSAFPYDTLVAKNSERTKFESEFELIDTGVFDEDRYFDVFVEYAKASPSDVLVQITVHNRGASPAQLHLLPSLWFRNTWSWGGNEERPSLELHSKTAAGCVVKATHSKLGAYYLYANGAVGALFTENETNNERLFASKNRTRYVKDGINQYLVHGEVRAVNPEHTGTKVALHYELTIAPRASQVVQLRLSATAPDCSKGSQFGQSFAEVLGLRLKEADEFYASVCPKGLSKAEASVFRQSLAGMLWSKQFYYYDVNRWLEEHGHDPLRAPTKAVPRNDHWHHLYNADVISMPDKWEYPWYAAWDLAFHVLPISLVDPEFGKQQLSLMLREHYMHPNGQLPAYEWNFGDVNPPVHAWAALFAYRMDKLATGKGDARWLEQCFQKLLLNFTWWVNRKDRHGRNVFEGGFLGLDNISVFDRSAELPTGGYLEQADGTAWMAFFCQNMFEISAELTQADSERDPAHAEMMLKFLQHFLWIGYSMVKRESECGLWDEEDGFFYDVLRVPDGHSQRLKVRSIVGLLPLCSATVFPRATADRHPELAKRFKGFIEARPELLEFIHDIRKPGHSNRALVSILNERNLRRVLSRMLDEKEFLSPYGIRSLSRFHEDHPYVFNTGGVDHTVAYWPAESHSGVFGGNSNWRGPIWMPINALIIRSLLHYFSYFGDDFKVEHPTGSGRLMNLYEVAEDLGHRLSKIFLADEHGHRPVFGGAKKFQSDPLWRDHLLFYEYFHGDNGAGLGASHQTGWTGIVARILHLFGTLTPEQILAEGAAAYTEPTR